MTMVYLIFVNKIGVWSTSKSLIVYLCAHVEYKSLMDADSKRLNQYIYDVFSFVAECSDYVVNSTTVPMTRHHLVVHKMGTTKPLI